jgi:alpha-L-fucosidase
MSEVTKQWFEKEKFGMFIHWGLYAVLAGEYKGRRTDHIAEWIMNTFNIPVEEYEKLAEQFDPREFDAEAIVKKAREWGMRYLVFTSKHHEGFAMYDSKVDDYNVVKKTPYGKDVVRQLSQACEKYGIRFGIYYSQAQDWHDPNGLANNYDNSAKDYQYYLDHKVKPQLRELFTEYGKISLIWFDTPMSTTPEQSRELVELVKSLQPDCVVSGRIGNEAGDYITTGDNTIPRLPYDKGAWELPATVNDTWGYNKFDHKWKSADEIIRLLLKAVSRGGNYLLNVGPDAQGRIPDACVAVLDEVGKYVSGNAEAIYDTSITAVYPYELDWAEFTHKEHKLYVHILKPKSIIELQNIANEVTRAYLVETKEDYNVKCEKSCEGASYISVELPETMWDRKNYCVCLEFEEAEPIFEAI